MINKLNEHEHDLICQFERHPLFLSLDHLHWDIVLAILIQRRYLSLSIVNVYEFVIDALADDATKETVRSILSEEFPRNSKGVPLPSHRELLLNDLINLGATREQVLVSAESEVTRAMRLNSLEELVNCLHHEHRDIALLSFLRFWGEVLVSVEYSILWRRISERLCNGAEAGLPRSEFYYYHMIHDRRQSDINDESWLGGLTHSQELARHMVRLIQNEESLKKAMQVEERVTRLKYKFYDQFLKGSLQV